MFTERPTCTTCAYWDKPNDLYSKGRCCLDQVVFEKGVYTDPGEFCGSHSGFPAYLASLMLPKVQVDEAGEDKAIVSPAFMEAIDDNPLVEHLRHYSDSPKYLVNRITQHIADIVFTNHSTFTLTDDVRAKVYGAMVNFEEFLPGYVTLKANAVEQANAIANRNDMIENMRGEVARLEELNDRQERGLDEARKTAEGNQAFVDRVRREREEANEKIEQLRKISKDWKAEYDGVCTEFVTMRDQANGRYQELAEAAQAGVDRWNDMDMRMTEWRSIGERLKAILARHARPADEATPNKPNTPGSHFKPTSLYLTLNTADLEQRTREMAEKLVGERVEPIRQAALEALRESAIYPLKNEHQTMWSAVPDAVLGRLERAVTGEPEPIATL